MWEFKLRQGVKFHNGNPFNADDVVFSLNRARQPTADMKGLLTSIEQRQQGRRPHRAHQDQGAEPAAAAYLTNLYMMDKEWSEANNTVTVQDYKAKVDNFAVRNANGTGPYMLVSREQDVQHRAQAQRGLLGQGRRCRSASPTSSISAIKSDATRVAALLSGEVDFVQDVPPQDIDRLEKTPNLKVNFGPENRTIFFGMDVASPELKTSNVKGKNPFADKRVRQAINMAIDREAHQARGHARPVGAGRHHRAAVRQRLHQGARHAAQGRPRRRPRRCSRRPAIATASTVTLHCPNDRYINDEGICTAATAMLAKIGIKVNLVSQPKGPHFTLIQKTPPETEFYLLGWGVPTYDSHYIFSFLYHTRTKSEGSWNATRYSNPEIDAAIRSLTSEVDKAKRNATIAKIWATLADETIYIATHHQMLAYAMTRDFDIPVSPENQVHVKFIAAK